eukprot:6202864-Pleurochrysis_carterae.AAC.2
MVLTEAREEGKVAGRPTPQAAACAAPVRHSSVFIIGAMLLAGAARDDRLFPSQARHFAKCLS